MGRTYGTHSNSALFPGLKSGVTKWIEPTALSYNDINYKLWRSAIHQQRAQPFVRLPKIQALKERDISSKDAALRNHFKITNVNWWCDLSFSYLKWAVPTALTPTLHFSPDWNPGVQNGSSLRLYLTMILITSSERAQYISKGRSPLSGYRKYKLWRSAIYPRRVQPFEITLK